MKRVKFKDGVCAALKIMKPPTGGEWATSDILKMVEKSLKEMHPYTEGLYKDLVDLLGEPLKIEWEHQIIMSEEHAMFIKLKYGDLVTYVKD